MAIARAAARASTLHTPGSSGGVRRRRRGNRRHRVVDPTSQYVAQSMLNAPMLIIDARHARHTCTHIHRAPPTWAHAGGSVWFWRSASLLRAKDS
eukprot:scaffold5263_cov146-Isochrysis_galbana.AAC.4